MLHFIDSLPVAQLIGFAALGFSLLVFQANKRSSILKLQMGAALLYAIHFFLLGAFTGSAMNMLGVVRNYIFGKLKIQQRTWWVPGIFIVGFIGAGTLSWHGPISILPTIAMISGTLAFWQLNPKAIRVLTLVSPPLWFTYNAFAGSYPGMAIEVMMFSSNLLGIYRFDLHTYTKITPKVKQ